MGLSTDAYTATNQQFCEKVVFCGEHQFLLVFLRIGGQQDIRIDTLSTVERNKDY